MARERVAMYLQDKHPIRDGMEYAKYAEAKGFEAVWQAESRLVRDAIVPMAAFAAVTDHLKIGSGVSPKEIVVFEIDPTLCNYIAGVAKARNLPIRVVQQDLTKLLPREFLGAFDTFVCDPPETRDGLLLFVEKGLTLLKPGDGRAGYFGATVIEGSQNKWKHWQKKLMCDYDIVYTHIFPAFTLYVSWHDEMPLEDIPALAKISDREWYRFAWNRIETMERFQPAPDFETEMQRVFYYDAESYYEAFPQTRTV